jgi:hypothetical protein
VLTGMPVLKLEAAIKQGEVNPGMTREDAEALGACKPSKPRKAVAAPAQTVQDGAQQPAASAPAEPPPPAADTAAPAADAAQLAALDYLESVHSRSNLAKIRSCLEDIEPLTEDVDSGENFEEVTGLLDALEDEEDKEAREELREELAYSLSTLVEAIRSEQAAAQDPQDAQEPAAAPAPAPPQMQPLEVVQGNPVTAQIAAQLAETELAEILADFASKVSEVMPRLGPLSSDGKFCLTETHKHALAAVERVAKYIETGVSDIDHASRGLSDG